MQIISYLLWYFGCSFLFRSTWPTDITVC